MKPKTLGVKNKMSKDIKLIMENFRNFEKKLLSEESSNKKKKSPEEQIKAKANGFPSCKESQVKCFPSGGGKPYAPSKSGEAPCRGTDKLKCDTGSQRSFEKYD